jgi:hypothetical protein
MANDTQIDPQKTPFLFSAGTLLAYKIPESVKLVSEKWFNPLHRKGL